MAIHVALNHVSHYRYDRAIHLGPQSVRLRPAPHCRTPILAYSLRIEPAAHFVNWQQDPFANYLARVVVPDAVREFKVTVDLVAEMAVFNPFDFFLEPSAERFPFVYDDETKVELAPYLAPGPLTPKLARMVDSIDRTSRRMIDFLVEINQRLQGDIRYLIRMEPGVQTPEETLESAAGSCRDSAWLMVQLMRRLGVAARFVSGYLIQLTADVKSLDGPSGASADFTDLHAWCEVYLPGAGWVGLDATSGLFAGEGHIPLACTPQPSAAAPISGLVDPCGVEFTHTMGVTRIFESPRVTKPYSDAQWNAVLALGDAVDRRLTEGDVRLTMGGEPTFVAADDREAGEWNTDALGPTKRHFAVELMRRLRERHGPGGFLHFGQGKWYPGEQLPRWALSAFWRVDGQRIWRDDRLFADESAVSETTNADARRFVERLAERLSVGTAHIAAAYEDTFYYLWRERKLPVNVDPFDSRLDDEMERLRLARVFGRGLDCEVGYVLPLGRKGEPDDPASRWASGPWLMRGERLFLLAGDSPMGYRLPLDSLPWVRKEEFPYLVDEDPFAPRDPLPTGDENETTEPPGSDDDPAARAAADAKAARRPRRHESAPWLPRTALCVEVRDPRRANGPKAEAVGNPSGVLYVFMPPLAHLPHYLELLAEVEHAAADTAVRIVVEGYPPPRDPRLAMLQVTPDPGVIEVNVQPVASWRALVENTEFLYDAARRTRLVAEKFMVDGRHAGTGGGNHMVLGGATPEDSPFLRRPELLASLLAYWHNHPSLSYLFSGLFIGPTSQAPRVDEARNDQIYELEIALAEIEKSRGVHGEQMPPWLVDRTLRNVLIDVTGNTHRSEFCIDKMYSPDGPTGRLGLLELRAFEMPPHAHMSSVQQLLLRAMVARFWSAPFRAPLARWGTELHDRFLLPEFVGMDWADVMLDMRAAGYAFDDAWFAPHFEFRFPKIGAVSASGVQIELRQALEPWHVMGEEASAGGTARYVDSSLERIEVKVSGLVEMRHLVTVNGIALPLQPTGRAGEFVAGVRYRAWHPPSALHPTIGVHAPLTFDLVDTWMHRSLGGCRYHVGHPGGRSYDVFPVNAYEAESRRLARFSAMGHTPGELKVDPPTRSLEFPFTLDLRTAR